MKKTNQTQRLTVLLVVLVVICIGSYLLIGSHAASPYASLSASSGTLDSGATSQSCSGASNGSCVVFQAGSSGTSSCTTTVNSVASAQTTVAATTSTNTTICMAPGTYGAIALTGNHTASSIVTFEPETNLDPNNAGKVTFTGGINIAGNYITVRNFYTNGAINVGPGTYNNILIDHNAVGPTNGYGISVLSPVSAPSSFVTISNNIIHDTSSTTEGDALRLDGWKDVTVTGNDIYNIKECPSNTCHTDTLQSYQADVATSDLTVTKNYIHDTNGAQGFPFLKDGDISNVTISDNLSLRMPSGGETTGFWVDENTSGLTITNNTYLGTTGSALEAGGSAASPSAIVTNNVQDQFNLNSPLYKLTENHNIFTGGNQWSFTVDPSDLPQGPYGTKYTPTYKCGSSCGNGTAAGDDYELANNTNNIGIDWSPANQKYGPTQ